MLTGVLNTYIEALYIYHSIMTVKINNALNQNYVFFSFTGMTILYYYYYTAIGVLNTYIKYMMFIIQ